MMKKAAFTLVELIVVITILAILGTIAFISLQGNTQDAKNSKVVSDVANLAKKISVVNAQGTTFGDMVVAGTSPAAANFADVTINGTGAVASGGTFTTGTADFGAIGEDAASFKDNSSQNYIVAVATTAYDPVAKNSDAYFQVAGQITENDIIIPIVKGNYSIVTTGDSASLISASDNTAVVHETPLATGVTLY